MLGLWLIGCIMYVLHVSRLLRFQKLFSNFNIYLLIKNKFHSIDLSRAVCFARCSTNDIIRKQNENYVQF